MVRPRSLLGLRDSVSRVALLTGLAPLVAGVIVTSGARAQLTINGTYNSTQTLETLCGGCASPSTATITSTGSIAAGAGNGLVGTTNSWSILNQGSVSGASGSSGIRLSGAAGTVTNAGTIASTGNVGRAVYFNNVAGMMTNQSGGVVSATGGGVGILFRGATGILVNQGLITGSQSGGGGTAVYLQQGGTVTNSGTIRTTGINAAGSVGFYGVRLQNGGTLINTGAITADGNAVITVGTSTIVNSGTIRSSTIEAFRNGTAASSLSITNQAGGLIAGATAGILMPASSGAVTLTNAGSITASSGPALQLTSASGHTVTNSGTIAGGAGTAIQFGNGNNTLVLQSGSKITGTVAGGTGTNTLMLQGGTLDFNLTNFSALSLSGSNNVISVPISFNSITFDGALTVTGALTVPTLAVGSGSSLAVGTADASSGRVTGDVTVTAGGLVSGFGTIAGNLANQGGTVKPGGSVGTLTVTGTYTQSSSGTLTIELSPAAGSKLAVGGSAAIAGTLAVTITTPSGRYLNKQVFPILTANGITGSFSSVTGASASTVSFALSQLANEIDLIASAATFTNLARTTNQRAIGLALDQAGTGTGTLATALAALAALPSDEQVRSGVDQIAGVAENYGNLANAGLATGRAVGAVVGQQAYMTHGASAGGTALVQGPGGAARVQLASLDPVAALAQGPSPSPAMTMSPWSAWLTGFGVFGTTRGNGNTHTLNYTTGGTAVGADYRLSPSFLLGAYASYGGSGTGTSGLPGSGSVDSVGTGVYASWLHGRSYLDGMLGYAYNDSSLRRTIAFPGFAALSARGNTHANQFLSEIEGGHRYDFPDKVTVTPFVGLQASVLDQASVTETGAGALNLAVGQQTVSSVRTQLGARVSRDLDLGEGVVINAGLKLGWAHELSDTGTTTTARFATTAGTGFAVQGAQRGRDTALVGIGVATKVDPQANLYLRYDGDLNGRDDAHAVMGGVRLTW